MRRRPPNPSAPARSGPRPKQRADVLLVDRALVESRSLAQALVREGRVFVGDKRVDTPGQLLAADAPLRLSEGRRYVSRGGDKMAGALAAFGLDVAGLVVLDVGASTGGFTDCVLQAGASRVYAVDVGRGQLDARLRDDKRVVSMERTNARTPFDLPERVDLIVADVSFISLRTVLPAVLSHLPPGGHLLAMVKPQFEAGRTKVGRGGVIRDPQTHGAVVGGFCLWAIRQGLRVLGVRPSPLTGDAGNREFFVLARVPRENA